MPNANTPHPSPAHLALMPNGQPNSLSRCISFPSRVARRFVFLALYPSSLLLLGSKVIMHRSRHSHQFHKHRNNQELKYNRKKVVASRPSKVPVTLLGGIVVQRGQEFVELRIDSL